MSVCVVGSINLDAVYRVERLPRAGETVLSTGLATYLGGKGANQAVASARIGAPTRMIGAVGDDAAGHDLLARLAAEEVDVSAVAVLEDAATGAAIICVADDGENQIVVSAGANGNLAPAGLQADRQRPDSVLLAQLETPVAALAPLLREADGLGMLRILNAAPALPGAAALFPLLDILIVNQTELALFAGVAEPPATLDGCLTAARGLLWSDEAVIVVTRGAAGAVGVMAKAHLETPGMPAKVVDTTGAGDCFCGALAAYLAAGDSLPDALTYANAAAAISVERAGAAASMPTAAEVADRLG